MEKISRVKKYEDLRKSIETENTVSDPTRDSMGEEQEEAFKKFDSSVLKKAHISDEDSYIPEREKDIPQQKDTSLVDDTFTNEYLDDFIREVREYNIQKGNRESEDTQVDILSQLNAANREKRAHYVEPIQEDNEEVKEERYKLSSDDIAKEVQGLLDEEEPITNQSALDEDIYATTELILEDDNSVVSEQPLQAETQPLNETISQPSLKKKILQPAYDVENTDLYDTANISSTNDEHTIHKQLMEETQQLRVQMDEYEDELTDLSDGVVKNNKILNFILCFLILVLLVIIGFIGYYIWKGGNL